MAVYMVERNLPGITMEQLAAAQKAAIEAGKRLTAPGKPVRYIRSTFVPCPTVATAATVVGGLIPANPAGATPLRSRAPVHDLTASALRYAQPLGQAPSCPQSFPPICRSWTC